MSGPTCGVLHSAIENFSSNIVMAGSISGNGVIRERGVSRKLHDVLGQLLYRLAQEEKTPPNFQGQQVEKSVYVLSPIGHSLQHPALVHPQALQAKAVMKKSRLRQRRKVIAQRKGETHLLAIHNGARQVTRGNLLQYPLVRGTSQTKCERQVQHGFYQPMVQKRRTTLHRSCHAHAVEAAQQRG